GGEHAWFSCSFLPAPRLSLMEPDPEPFVRLPRPGRGRIVRRIEDLLVLFSFGLDPGLNQVDQVSSRHRVRELEPVGRPPAESGSHSSRDQADKYSISSWVSFMAQACAPLPEAASAAGC